MNFDYGYSSLVGIPGWILCVWEKVVFEKKNMIISDSFVLVDVVWLSMGCSIIFIFIYATQDLLENGCCGIYYAILVIDFLCHFSDRSDSYVILMVILMKFVMRLNVLVRTLIIKVSWRLITLLHLKVWLTCLWEVILSVVLIIWHVRRASYTYF